MSLGIAFSDPDVCAVGARFDEIDPDAVLIGSATGEANGRSRILGGEASQLRVYADRTDGRLLGAAMMATGGEHLAHLLARNHGAEAAAAPGTNAALADEFRGFGFDVEQAPAAVGQLQAARRRVGTSTFRPSVFARC